MIIEVKYSVGDRVRYVHREQHRILEKCGCCGGNKAIIGLDYEEYTCPKCKGNGIVHVGYLDSEEVKEDVIWRVRVDYDSDLEDEIKIWYETPQDVFLQEDVLEKII